MINLLKPVLGESEYEAELRVMRSGWLGLGQETEKFEKEFAEYVGAKYAVGLNSCTSALHLALKLIEVNPFDEIITTPITFISTNMVMLYEKAMPVFVDVEPDTLNINPEEIKRKITNRTKAIMVVHYRGHPCEMDEINRIAKDNSLFVIEDCAHAAGAEYKDRKVGSEGNICCWSFHAVKNMNCGGDGGMLTTKNDEFYRKARKVRWLGIDKDTFSRTKEIGEKWYAWKYTVSEIGYKYHMNDMAAAIGREQLKVLDRNNKIRRNIVKVYKAELSGLPGIEILRDRDYVKSSNHLFVIKAERRNQMFMEFKANGIAAGMHYVPNHLFPIFRHLIPDVPVAEKVWHDLISLPLHIDLSHDDVQKICNVIKRHCGKEIKMDNGVLIRGEKTSLRYIGPNDLEQMVHWRNKNKGWFVYQGDVNIEGQKKWYEKYLKADDDKMFAIIIPGRAIGVLGFNDIDLEKGQAEFGRIFIGEEDCLHKGYATDALKALLKYAFEEMGLKMVFLEVFTYNDRAIGLYEKCGFKEVGRISKKISSGDEVEMFRMEVTNEGFANRQV